MPQNHFHLTEKNIKENKNIRNYAVQILLFADS